MRIRRQIRSKETQHRRVSVFHFTQAPSGLYNNTNMLYKNVLVEVAEREVPLILAASADPDRKFGRTLIVCSSDYRDKKTGPWVYDVLNDALKVITDVSLYNVTIYHTTNIPLCIIHDHVHPMSVRKIVNVILCEDETLLQYSKTHPGKKYTDWLGNVISFIFLPPEESESHGSDVAGQWWCRYFDKVPLCADGRVIQTEGTCWWNASANMLILTDSIAALLKIVWSSLPSEYVEMIESIQLDTCPTRDITPHDFMFVLINQLVIQGRKANNKNVDFSSDGAFLSVNSFHKAEWYQKAKRSNFVGFNNGYSRFNSKPIIGITVLLKELLTKGPHYNMIHPVLSLEEETIIQRTNYYEYWSHLEPDSETKKTWDAFPFPQIVVFRTTHSVACPRNIRVNGMMYDLESSALMLGKKKSDKPIEPSHVIAGLTCRASDGDKSRYVFDSNNIIGKDDWTAWRKFDHVVNQPRMQHYKDAMQNACKNRHLCFPAYTFMGFDLSIYSLRLGTTQQQSNVERSVFLF